MEKEKDFSKFWGNNHPLSKEKDRLWETYVPLQGSTKLLEINIFLAANRLSYDLYNNGWGCNNLTPELHFLHKRDFYKNISYTDLAEGNYDKYANNSYMDEEMEKVVKLVLEKEPNFTETEDTYENDDYGIPSEDWDNILYNYEDDDDEDEDDEYDTIEFEETGEEEDNEY